MSVLSWHVVLIAAAASGKGFLSNLSTVWVVMFFMLPVFNLFVFLMAAGRALAKYRLNWSHGILAALTLLPVVSFLLTQRLL